MKIPTVKIKHENGFCIINESDFDSSLHELFEVEVKPSTSKKRTSSKKKVSVKLIDLNTATQAELIKLKTVGTAKAKQIIASRPFPNLETAMKKLPDLNWDAIKNSISLE